MFSWKNNPAQPLCTLDEWREADTGPKMSMSLKQRLEGVIEELYHTHSYHQLPVCIVDQYENPGSTVCKKEELM